MTINKTRERASRGEKSARGGGEGGHNTFHAFLVHTKQAIENIKQSKKNNQLKKEK